MLKSTESNPSELFVVFLSLSRCHEIGHYCFLPSPLQFTKCDPSLISFINSMKSLNSLWHIYLILKHTMTISSASFLPYLRMNSGNGTRYGYPFFLAWAVWSTARALSCWHTTSCWKPRGSPVRLARIHRTKWVPPVPTPRRTSRHVLRYVAAAVRMCRVWENWSCDPVGNFYRTIAILHIHFMRCNFFFTMFWQPSIGTITSGVEEMPLLSVSFFSFKLSSVSLWLWPMTVTTHCEACTALDNCGHAFECYYGHGWISVFFCDMFPLYMKSFYWVDPLPKESYKMSNGFTIS
jgi:hypothetical protein